MSNVSYYTAEGLKKLRNELRQLKDIERPKASQAIGEARDKVDLSENAEYDAAKEAQGLNEKKIAKLQEKLSRTQLLDGTNISKDEAFIGATVKLKDLDSGEELEYTLVSEVEADFAQGKISVTSPVGKSLLGHKKNEIVKIKIPAGIIRYKILKISR